MGLSPQTPESKLRMGAVLQEANFPGNLKVRELVQLVKSYYPNSISVESLLGKVELLEMQEAWASNLSGGQKQRLYFALALAGSPALLILDEPTRNLDDKGYEEFWQQIRLCREQGVTILMVTNNKSDWPVLEKLATRKITLHKLTESNKNCQLVDNNLSEEPQKTATKTSRIISTKSNQNISYYHLLQVFQQQLWVEILQIWRTPIFLLCILLIEFLPTTIVNDKESLISFYGIIFFTIAIERVGSRVAIERTEKWLKFLRTTPLSPSLYIATKIFTVLLLCTFVLPVILTISFWKPAIEISFGVGIEIFMSMILGVIPFAIIGLGLSYLISPKSYNSIAAGVILIGLTTYSDKSLNGFPQFIQDIGAFSPFYHYGQLALWVSGSGSDSHLWLHLLWLLWAGVSFGSITIWAYQRDSVVQ